MMKNKKILVAHPRRAHSFAAISAPFAIASLVVCASIAGTSVKAAEPDGPDTLISEQDALEFQLMQKIKTAFSNKTAYGKDLRRSVRNYYLDRNRQPIWLTKKGLSPKAKTLMKEIEKGDEYGLKVEDIKFPSKKLASGTPAERAEAEIMMSRAVLTYAKRAKGGHLVPQKISRYLDNTPPTPDAAKVLAELSDTNSPAKLLLTYHPKHPQFWSLKKQLDAYKSAVGKTEKIIKIPNGPTIQPFDMHPDVAILRKRFKQKVPMRGNKPLFPIDSYDSHLADAVKKFQAANGLRANGIINRSTRAKLNKGKPNRIKQILANMERWRWMPEELGDFHIRVNVPEYLVRVTKDNKIIHTERVITGKKRNATPTFSDEMETVVFNPYWNVPQSIIWNEMGGVAPRGYQSRVVNGRVFIRQPPGPRNALGIVKFLFPNRHSVYMHDTPTKPLFNKQVRAFSHGCMRLRDPLKMAEIVLKENKISRKKINAMVRNGKNQQIPLKNKIPVHVSYFTAWVGDDGKTTYFNDIYGHDKRVISALEGRPMGLEPKTRIARRPKPVEKPSSGTNFLTYFFNN